MKGKIYINSTSVIYNKLLCKECTEVEFDIVYDDLTIVKSKLTLNGIHHNKQVINTIAKIYRGELKFG